MSITQSLDYRKRFDPATLEADWSIASSAMPAADRRDGWGYVYTEEIILAVNVALATKRPLLVRGPSGSGKSSLAASVALVLKWRYYEEVISSHTQAQDLLWKFDTLRRLNDAQGEKLAPNPEYVNPGILWWAFDSTSAQRRGVPLDQAAPVAARDPAIHPDRLRAVVLLDEIDKADPDVPNDLLVALGSWQFPVEHTGCTVHADTMNWPLVIITTNDERELPVAFQRRCVILKLPAPNWQRLVAIARRRFPGIKDQYEALFETIAKLVDPEVAPNVKMISRPSTAEFLDAVQACMDLNIQPQQGDPTWDALAATILWKPRDSGGPV